MTAPKLLFAILGMTAWLWEAKAMSFPYEFSYGGRLIESNGQPVKGPVDISIRFYRSESGSDEVTGITSPIFTNVDLNEGIFQVKIVLSPADFHLVFNTQDNVWIQVSDLSNSRTYPRQKFSAAPYALKVPVDDQSITYNVDGKLILGSPKAVRIQSGNGSGAVVFKTPDGLGSDTTYHLPATDGASGQVLKTDGAGNLGWATPSGAGDLLSSANLSDLSDATAARLNLGLGAAATKSVGTGANDVAAGNHTHTGYLSSANNLNDIGNTSAARTNLGLGTAAVKNVGTGANDVAAGDHTHSGYLSAASNLNDVADAATARTNLGLGSIATLNEVGGTNITNDSITDFDIASNAGISGGKINPNFGNQNVATTGNIQGAGLTGTTLNAKASGDVGVITLKAPDNQSTNRTFTLPGTYGTSGQFLKSDGAGGLIWDTIGGGGDMAKAENLAGLADVAAARTNLGLGDSATKNVGTSAGTIAAGDHGHDAADISDFNTAVAAAPAVAANTAKNSYPAADATKVGHLSVTAATDLDAIRTKASHITVTQSVDLDNMKADIASQATTVTSHATTLAGLGTAATKNVGTGANDVAAGDHTHSGYLSAASNLSDVSDATTARTNLGLGDSATKSVGTGGNDVAAGNHTHSGYLNAASNLSDVSDATTARTNLGLGDSATKSVGTGANDVAAGNHTHSGYLSGANNLNDVADAAAARSNLGLGTVATKSTIGTDEITNATIADIDIASNANISGGKINPNFGNQNIATTGNITGATFYGSGAGLTAIPRESLLKLSYISPSSMGVYCHYCHSNSMIVQLNDGTFRSATPGLIFDFSNGVGDLGLDTGTEKTFFWYFVYAVPVNSTTFTIRASTTAPHSGGPTGFPVHKYLGAFINGSSGDIVPFIQKGKNKFFYYEKLLLWQSGGDQASHTMVVTLVPSTATTAFFQSDLVHNGTAGCGTTQYFAPIGGGNHAFFWTNGNPYDRASGQFQIPMDTTRNLVHASNSEGCSPTRINIEHIYVTGWEDGYIQ